MKFAELSDIFDQVEVWSKQFESILKEQNPEFKAINDYRKLVNVIPGSEETKFVDEAIEWAMIRLVRENWKYYSEHLEELISLSEYCPRLAVRTGDSLRRQAFSTPIVIAAVASKLLDCAEETTVYEPTAGMGALLLAANPEVTHANELDPFRALVLSETDFVVTMDNAATYYPPEKVDRIITNPPFGKSKLSGMDRPYLDYLFDQPLKLTELDAIIPLVALHQLKDDGKAVLIVKGVLGVTDEERLKVYQSYAQKVKFYDLLYDHYNVTHHVTLSGEMYRKQGAGYPVDLIVINGRSPSRKAKPHQISPFLIQNNIDLINYKWDNN